MWKSRNLFIEFLVRGDAEEKKMYQKRTFVVGSYVDNIVPNQHINIIEKWLIHFGKKGCSLEIKLEVFRQMRCFKPRWALNMDSEEVKLKLDSKNQHL